MNEPRTPHLGTAGGAGRSVPQPAAIAQAILEGFDRHYRLFRYVAQQAKSRYESGAWQRMQESARSRIDFYDQRANEAVARVRAEFDFDSLREDERDPLWTRVQRWLLGTAFGALAIWLAATPRHTPTQ